MPGDLSLRLRRSEHPGQELAQGSLAVCDKGVADRDELRAGRRSLDEDRHGAIEAVLDERGTKADQLTDEVGAQIARHPVVWHCAVASERVGEQVDALRPVGIHGCPGVSSALRHAGLGDGVPAMVDEQGHGRVEDVVAGAGDARVNVARVFRGIPYPASYTAVSSSEPRGLILDNVYVTLLIIHFATGSVAAPFPRSSPWRTTAMKSTMKSPPVDLYPSLPGRGPDRAIDGGIAAGRVE